MDLIERVDKTRSGVILPSLYQFKGEDKEEPVVCSKFGCVVHLSLEEMRFGKYCCKHNGEKKVDPTKFISHPIKKTA